MLTALKNRLELAKADMLTCDLASRAAGETARTKQEALEKALERVNNLSHALRLLEKDGF